MHEQSLVRALLKQLAEIRRQHEGREVAQVRVEFGPLSGVEPLLLSSAFRQLAPAGGAAHAELIITEVPLTARCDACRQEFEIVNFIFRCRTCHGHVHVTGGDGLQLESVTLFEDSPLRETVS